MQFFFFRASAEAVIFSKRRVFSLVLSGKLWSNVVIDTYTKKFKKFQRFKKESQTRLKLTDDSEVHKKINKYTQGGSSVIPTWGYKWIKNNQDAEKKKKN